MNHNYEITHSWGDPRESQYHDDLPVAYVTYRYNGIPLYFKIIPKKQHEDGKILLTIEAPATIGEAVGGSGKKCMAICNRVIEYVNSANFSTSWHRRGFTINEVSLNTSKIPGWLTTQSRIFRRRHSRLLMRLPTIFPATILICGYLVGYLSHFHQVSIPHNVSVKALLLTLGCVALLRLSIEIHKDYELSKIMLVTARLKNPKLNYKWAATKNTVRVYSVRYALTSILSGLLICLAIYYF